MSESRGTLKRMVQTFNEMGGLYVVTGLASAILSLVFLPLLGLLAVYCGYQLYRTYERTLLAVVITGAGTVGFLWWVLYLLTR